MKAANVQLAAAGRAYLSVAQTAAIAIQDATDYLRSISTISSTAAGIGIAMVIAGETEKGAKVISTASELASKGVTHFGDIGKAAIKVATDFPQCFTPKAG